MNNKREENALIGIITFNPCKFFTPALADDLSHPGLSSLIIIIIIISCEFFKPVVTRGISLDSE